MIKLRLLAKLKIKKLRNKKYNVNEHQHVHTLCIIDTHLEDEQRTTASTEIYCCWRILMFSQSFTMHHRIVIISYYQKCNGFLVQCICMACVVKMINYKCMFLQTDIISAVVVLLYWGLFMTSRFRYEGFKNNSFFTSSEVHLACSERLTFVLV